VDSERTLHVGKTELILFGTKKRLKAAGQFEVFCDGSLVSRVTSIKYLGFILDECQSGQDHVLGLIKKVASRLAFLYRSAPLLDQRSRKTLCLALIQPYFDYSCTSWYSGLNAKLRGKLDVLQRKMVRFIFKMDPRSHVGQEQLKQLLWLSVSDRVRYFKLVHMYKVSKGLAPSYVSVGFKPITEVHSHRTRSSSMSYYIPKGDAVGAMSHSFKYTASKDWNRLPCGLKLSLNIDTFKRDLKSYLLDS
jgi:hypothetical protein